ncbi:unnamed protein product [Arabis nemorensis]|uniref:AIG1-type G domain-containing protein n=1 Tax=Arabis nemorensis TaxID=586526 RepID=A0A565C510_9BRAS|nr:unnamed protein product [Arabis nemorensis]
MDISVCKGGMGQLDYMIVVFTNGGSSQRRDRHGSFGTFLEKLANRRREIYAFCVKTIFGSDFIDYMIVIFTNEDTLVDNNETMKDYLEGSPHFKENLTACDNRMVLFDDRPKTGQKKKAKRVQKLLNLVEKVVRKNNKKPFMETKATEKD